MTGLLVVAGALAVLAVAGWGRGSGDALVATCVLVIWAGGIATLAGLVMRFLGRAPNPASPLSPQWTSSPGDRRPLPADRRRHRSA